jgi:hypothetical protein
MLYEAVENPSMSLLISTATTGLLLTPTKIQARCHKTRVTLARIVKEGENHCYTDSDTTTYSSTEAV